MAARRARGEAEAGAIVRARRLHRSDPARCRWSRPRTSLAVDVLVDARAAERYAGETSPSTRSPGTSRVRSTCRRPRTSTIRRPLPVRRRAAGGVRPRGRRHRRTTVAAYCGSGRDRRHDVLAMEVAGSGPRSTPGRWSGWITRPGRGRWSGAMSDQEAVTLGADPDGAHGDRHQCAARMVACQPNSRMPAPAFGSAPWRWSDVDAGRWCVITHRLDGLGDRSRRHRLRRVRARQPPPRARAAARRSSLPTTSARCGTPSSGCGRRTTARAERLPEARPPTSASTASGHSPRRCGTWSSSPKLGQPHDPRRGTALPPAGRCRRRPTTPEDAAALGIDVTAEPSYAEVLAARADRMALVASRRRRRRGRRPGAAPASGRRRRATPRSRDRSCECLGVVMEEEVEHHRFAVDVSWTSRTGGQSCLPPPNMISSQLGTDARPLRLARAGGSARRPGRRPRRSARRWRARRRALDLAVRVIGPSSR